MQTLPKYFLFYTENPTTFALKHEKHNKQFAVIIVVVIVGNSIEIIVESELLTTNE